MPLNNDLEPIVLPMDLKFNQPFTTKFENKAKALRKSPTAQPPKNDRRTSGLESKARPVSVYRLRPWTIT